jgi:hypothetical protein
LSNQQPATSNQQPTTSNIRRKKNIARKKLCSYFAPRSQLAFVLRPMWASDLAALLAARDSGGTFAADD